MNIKYFATRNLIAAHQPVELLTGGDFASNAGWTLNGWTISGGIAVKAAGVAGDLTRDINVIEGLNYDIVYTIVSATAGAVTQKVAGTSGAARTAASIYAETIVAGAGASLRFKASADAAFDGSIDNVSVMLGTNAYDFEFKVNANKVSSTDKIDIKSTDKTAQIITLNSDYTEYQITTELVEYGSAAWLQFQEFFNSVREGEVFDLDLRGTIASPINVEQVRIIGRETEEYVEADLYRFQFSVSVQ